MATAPIGGTTGANALDFVSMLRLILAELTFQDPLKPMESSTFVSQLAQFSQLQQSQSLNQQIGSLVAAQATMQATGLLGRTVDFDAGGQVATGVVQAVSLNGALPMATIQTTGGAVAANVPLSDVTQVR
jgi:flagellar basal-body rod modification protein FlgD